MVAGAMERRLFVRTANSELFTNMFTLLVGPPASGKTQAITHVRDFWKRVKDLRLAPDNVTRESLLDALEAAKRTILINPQRLLEYHSLLTACSEFGVLIPVHDMAFLSTLNHIFDCPQDHTETRRTTKKELIIIRPYLHMIAGTQPDYLAELLPEAAWGMGYTSRLLMIYSGEVPKVSLFDMPLPNEQLRSDIVHDLNVVSTLHGQLQFAKDASRAVEVWAANGYKPEPTHSRLESYKGRRIIYLLKLMMVSSVSYSNSMVIEHSDFERALNWLLEAETTMPNIFRAMSRRSDQQVILECHLYLMQTYAKTAAPIHQSEMIQFLANRVPVEKVGRVIEIMTLSQFIKPAGEGLWIPVARGLSGIIE